MTPRAKSGIFAVVTAGVLVAVAVAAIVLWPRHQPDAKVTTAELEHFAIGGVLQVIGIKVEGTYKNTTDETRNVAIHVAPGDRSLAERTVRETVYSGQDWKWELEFPTGTWGASTLDAAATGANLAEATLESGFEITAVDEEPVG